MIKYASTVQSCQYPEHNMQTSCPSCFQSGVHHSSPPAAPPITAYKYCSACVLLSDSHVSAAASVSGTTLPGANHVSKNNQSSALATLLGHPTSTVLVFQKFCHIIIGHIGACTCNNNRLKSCLPDFNFPLPLWYCSFLLMQTAVERQDSPRTYLAHHELESDSIIVLVITNCYSLDAGQPVPATWATRSSISSRPASQQ